MTNRKPTFTNAGVIQGSRVWRNQETGVEIIEGEGEVFSIAVPTLDSSGRYLGATCTSLATARRVAAMHVEQWRARISRAHAEARLEDADFRAMAVA